RGGLPAPGGGVGRGLRPGPPFGCEAQARSGDKENRPMQLGLLLCDHTDEDFRRRGGDYPDLFLERIHEVEPAARLEAFDAAAGELPAPDMALDGWIISGARHDAFGDAPWLARLRERLAGLLARGQRV